MQQYFFCSTSSFFIFILSSYFYLSASEGQAVDFRPDFSGS